MFFDARELPHEALIETDLCIVGAGPLGIALARELADSGLRIALLESGGLRAAEAATELGQPEANVPDAGLRWTTRQFGGNANVWSVRTDQSAAGVRLLPLARADLERRDGLADSGWPIPPAELAGCYERAQRVFGLPSTGFDPTPWEDPWARQLPGLGPDVRTGIFQFGNRDDFTGTCAEALRRSGAVSVYHHATAVEIETDPQGGRVETLRAASTPERRLRLRAAHFVLATGGLATPQLLLSSDRRHPGGLGNGHDLVGRYYMDHPLVLGGSFSPASRRLFEATDLYDLRTVRGTPVMAHLQLTDAALRRRGVLGASLLLLPRTHLTERQREGVEATRRLVRALRDHRPPAAADLRAAALGSGGLARKVRDRLLPVHPHADLGRGGWSRLADKARRFGHYEVLHQAEQPPRRDNRVRLGEARDRFGSRRIRIDWQWHEADVAAFQRTQDIFAAALRGAGLGEFTVARPEGRPVVLSGSTAHYMGTTRMHDDPRRGVVDAQCRVHGVDNLFVAGSGVFPTGGFANPTLTSMALTLRLADRLRALRERQAAPITIRENA